MRRLDAVDSPLPGVGQMAAQAGMSRAACHRHFKTSFGFDPLQHFKRQCLFRAHKMHAFEGAKVAKTSRVIRYAGAS